MTTWSFTNLWNESVIASNKPVIPRNYCYASELGWPLVDRYLKMTGVQPTNPPNMRSLRKFEAGNIMEWIVRFVLTRAGLIQDCQERVIVEYPGLLPVHGRLDFKAGGVLDAERAVYDIQHLNLPQSIVDASLYIVQKLSEKFGDKPLKDIVLEIKSCSTFVMDMLEKTEKPIKGHVFQAFHYIKGLGMDEAHVAYICKDDMRMAEFPVFNPSHTENLYVGDLMQITKYYNEGQMPPLEKAVQWVQEEGRMKKSIGIEYSPYLTMLYGFETPRDYSDSVSPTVARWNRVLTRYSVIAGKIEEKTGKSLQEILPDIALLSKDVDQKITAKNEEVKKEIVASGYNFDELIYIKRELGVEETEEE